MAQQPFHPSPQYAEPAPDCCPSCRASIPADERRLVTKNGQRIALCRDCYVRHGWGKR